MRLKGKKTSRKSSHQPEPFRSPQESIPAARPIVKLEPRPADPLLFDFGLPLVRTYYPLGFPLEITTNSAGVLQAAEESWGKFQKTFSTPPVRIRLGVLPGSSSTCPPAPACRGQHHLITQVADAENYLVLDNREGFAFGWLTEAAAQKRAYLRYHFLEGAALVLLECLYLTPVHAACVSLDGRGVLLCGDGGAGKSSLSYACAQNGWTFLSDDSAMLVRQNPERLVIGNPYQMRFRDSATELFPELSTRSVTERLSGELSIELETASVPGISTTTQCTIDYLVFLNRYNPQPEGLLRLEGEQVLPWLRQVVCYGEARLRDEHRATLGKLATAGIFEMRYTKMDTALGLLEGLVRNGRVPAEPCLVAAGEF
jgi:hypothetical protein